MFYPSEEAHSLKNQSSDKSVEDEELDIEENVETPNKHLKKVAGYVTGAIVVAAIITVVFLAVMNGYDQKLQDQREFFKSSSQESFECPEGEQYTLNGCASC